MLQTGNEGFASGRARNTAAARPGRNVSAKMRRKRCSDPRYSRANQYPVAVSNYFSLVNVLNPPFFSRLFYSLAPFFRPSRRENSTVVRG